MKSYSNIAKQLENNRLQKSRRTRYWQCYLMIALPMIGFLVLTVYPVFWTFKWSWFTYTNIPSETHYIGWSNFIKMFSTDLSYWKAWGNTLLFAFIKIPIELSLAMLLAVLLNQKLRGSGFFRVMFYLPNIISVAIIGLIFYNLFSYWGIINSLLVKYGFLDTKIDWFASKGTAMAVLVIGGIWNTFGINVMYFIAAFTNVPEELYECAKLDGASAWTTFYKITLPMIAPIFQIIILLSIIGTLSVNEYILVLTGGAPGGKTLSVMSYLTQRFIPGFMETTTAPNIGYGCAMSLVTTVIFAIVALLYNTLSKKMNSIF